MPWLWAEPDACVPAQVMEGNKNAYAPVINDLHPPVVTRWVRLIPRTELSTVCMRVELYGCHWEGRPRPRRAFLPSMVADVCVCRPTDGLISYTAPEGQLMAQPGLPTAILNDTTYDGTHQKRPVKTTTKKPLTYVPCVFSVTHE